LISELLLIKPGDEFESIARFWIVCKIHLITNTISSAVLWRLWKLHNDLSFHGATSLEKEANIMLRVDEC